MLQARAAPVPELEHSTSPSTNSLVDVDSPHVNTVKADFQDQKVKTETQAARIEREMEVEAKKLEAKAKSTASKAKSKGKSGIDALKANSDNPVVIGNAVLYVALAGGVGYFTYIKQKAGEFNWKIAGLGVAAVSVFGVADYYASQ